MGTKVKNFWNDDPECQWWATDIHKNLTHQSCRVIYIVRIYHIPVILKSQVVRERLFPRSYIILHTWIWEYLILQELPWLQQTINLCLFIKISQSQNATANWSVKIIISIIHYRNIDKLQFVDRKVRSSLLLLLWSTVMSFITKWN